MARKDISDQLVCLIYSWRHAMILQGTDPPWPTQLLVIQTGEPEKVCEAAMERAADHGLIEYGVSLRSGWLTEAGRALADDANTLRFSFSLTSEEPAHADLP